MSRNKTRKEHQAAIVSAAMDLDDAIDSAIADEGGTPEAGLLARQRPSTDIMDLLHILDLLDKAHR